MSEATQSPTLRAAVVGTGHLGRHHVRILAGLPGIDMIGAYDSNREQLEKITSDNQVPALDSVDDAFAADLIVVATPTVAHHEVASAALGRGCHVLIEKPISTTVDEARDLIELAEANQKVLAVGHTEFHNPAVQSSLGLVDGVRYLEAQRLAPFTARSVDVDVILDLMIHDLQIALAVAGEEPCHIHAVGVPVLTEKVDLCHAWIEFPCGLVANLTASRVSAEPVRKLRLFAGDAYFSVDYGEQSVSSVRLEISPEGHQITPQVVDVTPAEPLTAELTAFVETCRGNSVPYVDGATGTSALAAAIAVRECVEAR